MAHELVWTSPRRIPEASLVRSLLVHWNWRKNK